MAEAFSAALKNEEATGTYVTELGAHTGIAIHFLGFYNPTRREETCRRMTTLGRP